jgi:valyl-tRNA synthetase
MALVMSTTAGKDSNTGETKIRGMRNLTNKIWNAARFILIQQNAFSSKNVIPASEERARPESSKDSGVAAALYNDEEFYKKLNSIIQTVTKQLDDLKIGLAAETLYQEFWHWFCDICIEQTKRGELSKEALKYGFESFLKLLHPFVPFVTEAIWQQFPMKKSESLIASLWPEVKK